MKCETGTNTFSKKNPNRKQTPMSPNGITKNMIDFILTNKKGIEQDVKVQNGVTTRRLMRLDCKD